MKLHLIACEILFREICHLVAESPHLCDVQFVAKGLHDLGSDKMMPRLQEYVDAVPADKYDAILLGYGLCNNGIAGLTARKTQLVVPRAHDCITLLLGSRKKYEDYFNSHPGTYYRSSGWFERNDSTGAGEETVPQKLGLFMKYEELVQKYGEDNAQYILETMGDPTAHYDRVAFIRTGLSCDDHFREKSIQWARDKGWAFEELDGSLELLRKLVCGRWDDDFLVVPPGASIHPSYKPDVIRT